MLHFHLPHTLKFADSPVFVACWYGFPQFRVNVCSFVLRIHEVALLTPAVFKITVDEPHHFLLREQYISN